MKSGFVCFAPTMSKWLLRAAMGLSAIFNLENFCRRRLGRRALLSSHSSAILEPKRYRGKFCRALVGLTGSWVA